MRDIKDELKAAIDAFNFQPGSMVHDAYTEIISLRHRLTPAASLSPAPTSGSEAGGEPVAPNEHGILPCKCGSYPTPSGDGARPDDGYRTLWCHSCQKHVTEWHSSEEAAIRAWNEERELDTGATSHYSTAQTEEADLATPAPSPAGGVREALKPFADAAEPIVHDTKEKWDPDSWLALMAKLTVGDFRRLHRVYAALSPATAARGGDQVETLRARLGSYAIREEVDFPAEAPEFCGYWCDECKDHVEADGSGHGTDCPCHGVAPMTPRAIKERSALASPDAKREAGA